MGQHHVDARYEERSGPQIDAAAAATLVKGTERRGEVDYEVDCPTCHGRVRVTEYPGGTYRAAPTTDTATDVHANPTSPPAPAPASAAAAVRVVPMVCGCGLRHPGATDGVTGCGTVWFVPA